jgi:hypothetical protein
LPHGNFLQMIEINGLQKWLPNYIEINYKNY